ncbi:hypothetical protein [Halioxenophilus sp. WMMB6]|uniref:hypothetical protein n=1 Tax=Halioxenophilus sp. WMMB6 TaxID=3073815 RepID=UPI00295EC591|nr:hypothetical protein [Halioxenophilus sp. WMMB6]
MNSLPEIAKKILLARQGHSAVADPQPTLEELALLLDDKLSFQRKQAVYAWLNRSPELFAQWIRLVEAQEEVSQLAAAKPPLGLLARLSVWWQQLPVKAATGVAVCGLAAILVWQLNPTEQFSALPASEPAQAFTQPAGESASPWLTLAEEVNSQCQQPGGLSPARLALYQASLRRLVADTEPESLPGPVQALPEGQLSAPALCLLAQQLLASS